MYKVFNYNSTGLNINNSTEGESLEDKVKRITNNKEPIKDGAPLIYTDKKDGVIAGYNIRTDRFDIAIDAMDIVHKSTIAQREARAKAKNASTEDTTKVVDIAKGESTNGTNSVE